MPFGFKSLVVDVSATFEAQSGYHLTPGIDHKFAELQRRYKSFILMGSKFGGRARLFTEPKGMSACARIDVGIRVGKAAKLERKLKRLLPMFREAQESATASGPLSRLTLEFSREPKDEAVLLDMMQASFVEVYGDLFGDECVFRIGGRSYEVGKAKVHEPLVDYVRGTGPYNVAARRALDDLSEFIQKEKGTFEDVRIWVSVAKADRSDGERVPPVYYSSRLARADVERQVQEEWKRPVTRLSEAEVEQRAKDLVELHEFLLASRTYGSVWTMRGRVVRGMRRDYLPVLEVMLPGPEQLEAGLFEWTSWEELAKRVSRSPKVSKSQAASPTFLQKALDNLQNAELVREKAGEYEYALAPDFAQLQHVSYYSLGEWKG